MNFLSIFGKQFCYNLKIENHFIQRRTKQNSIAKSLTLMLCPMVKLN